MYDELRSVPCEKRPRLLSLFPGGRAYFRSGRAWLMFGALLLPIAASSIAQYAKTQKLGGAIVIFLIGSVCACFGYVAVRAGVISSNTGTYFRQSEPVRYWMSVGLMIAGYVAFSIAGYFGLK